MPVTLFQKDQIDEILDREAPPPGGHLEKYPLPRPCVRCSVVVTASIPGVCPRCRRLLDRLMRKAIDRRRQRELTRRASQLNRTRQSRPVRTPRVYTIVKG